MNQKMKVLVVDDEHHIRLLYQSELESEGYAVATSDGVEEILDVLSREQPHVVILDINLGMGSGRTGLDLLAEIREKDRFLPIVLCTAYESYQHDSKSLEADYYVVKSVDLSDLKSKVALAMAKAAA